MEHSPLRCSVIIPTYNRMGLLRSTLESLTAQDLPLDQFEVLVVDDGSSDGTAAMVHEFDERLRLRYFFQPDEGFRVAQARNVGISNARSEVCVFIDSGLLLHSGCLSAHVATHAAAAGPVAVCGYVYGFQLDDTNADLLGGDIDVQRPTATIDRFAREGRWLDFREEFYGKYGDDFADLPAPWLVFWTANVSAGTAQLRSIGMFDEEFRSWGGEDLELGYRLHRSGARFVLDRRASAIHLPHEKKWPSTDRAEAANNRYIAFKHDTPITRLFLLFPYITPFTMNDVIRDLKLPSCEDYLTSQAISGSLADNG